MMGGAMSIAYMGFISSECKMRKIHTHFLCSVIALSQKNPMMAIRWHMDC
jgi:hypothetical protein